MNMSYRHRSMMVLMIAAVSVFLCSCGIPTYWEPSNSDTTVVRKLSEEEDSEGNKVLNFNVRVDYYTGDDGENAPNMGLLLLYVYSDSTNISLSTELVKKFNSDYRGTIPYGVSTLTATNDNPVWEFTVDETDYGIYAFTDSNGEPVEAYKYNLDITSASSFNTKFSLKLVDNTDEGIEIYEDGSTSKTASYGFGLGSSRMSELKDSKYIHVYAAISAQGNVYSNLYWSHLEYVGSFEQDMTSKSQTTSTETSNN